MQFSKKIVISILIIQIVGSLIYNYLYHYQYTTVLDMTIKKKERDTNYVVENIFNEVRQKYTDFGNKLLKNPEIIEAFADKNREELLRLTAPIYKRLKEDNSYFNIMNFYTPDTHDFLRLNKPELFGNNLQSFHKITVK
ncbi:MAG: hypothetical protein WC272_11185, partial [Sulfurimonas sp.]